MSSRYCAMFWRESWARSNDQCNGGVARWRKGGRNSGWFKTWLADDHMFDVFAVRTLFQGSEVISFDFNENHDPFWEYETS